MQLAIHYSPGNNFSSYWLRYCQDQGISHKLVNCYDNDIMCQLNDCNALMWHVNNFDYRDQIFAKNLIKAVEEKGISVFPNYNSVWHFDDKVAQKYLLESINAPLVKTYVFFSKKDAKRWAKNTNYPVVFKLRKGSGSKNVLLVKSYSHALRLINKMFGNGILPLNMTSMLKERFRKYKLGKEPFIGLIKGVVRLGIGTPYLNMSVGEKGYAYFQEYLPYNSFDQRIIVIGQKAFFIKRMVRENDFRASGSGHIVYDKSQVDLKCIEIAFKISDKLGFNCMAYDFIYDNEKNPMVVEISFGFNQLGYIDCQGYWDQNLIWNKENVLPQQWMVDDLIHSCKS